MNVNFSQKVCLIPPSNDCERLVRYYMHEYALKKNNENAKLTNKKIKAIFSAKRKQLVRQFQRGAPFVQNLRGRSLQPMAHPLRICTSFLLFIRDVLEIYEDYSEDKDFTEDALNLLSAYANYRYHPQDPDAKKWFSEVIQSLCRKLEEAFPLSNEIRRDFEHWIEVIEQDVDILELRLLCLIGIFVLLPRVLLPLPR